jgi:diguanylate cyclase (GGDEF)-like protein
MNTVQGPFGDCKNAILQSIGNVQSNGLLVAINSASDRIEYCSANSAEVLGIEPAQLLGKTGPEWLASTWPGLSLLASGDGSLEWSDFPGRHPVTVVGHKQGAHRILEFERGWSTRKHWWNHASRTRFVEQLTTVHTTEQCREFLVAWVFEHSGYDRVMMYHFLPNWHGEVVHERCRPRIEGFLGLRFPASDIPANARQMFALNWQRAIMNVDSDTAPILKSTRDAPPLDLTYSTLRSAHPAHIQYLKNMGVQASLTLSMVVNGKLWGLIACHHLSARTLPIQDRLAFEEMARIVSLHLTNLLGLIEQRLQSELRQQLSRLQGAMSTIGDNARLALLSNLGVIRQTFSSDGAWLRFEGEDFFAGLVPDKLSLAPLRDILDLLPREHVSHYGELPESLQSYRALQAHASGVLFIPLGSTDFIALMRPEVIDTVNWAGKPEAREDGAALAALPLTPRNSFAVWSERVRNTSEPWIAAEVEFGEKLRMDLEQFLGTARLEQIALHDSLTGLANRLLFERRLQQEVRNAMVRNSAFAVYMIDLNRFKQVNDTFGHSAGDQVLTEVAARLLSVVGPEDTVARLGGDEFAIIQACLDATSAVSMAGKIVQAVSQIYAISGNTAEIGASVGVAICPLDTVEGTELLECADLALYQVKRSGQNAYSMYAPEMRKVISRSTDGELLVKALRENEFKLHYQPIVDARSGELRGLEAFLRWHQPGVGDRAAAEFMPLIEQKRLGPAVGEWVMDAVFKQYREWLREGLPMVPITINVGNDEFASKDLLGQFERFGALYETGWQWLRLDIKEQALVADVRQAIRKLGNLREAGIGANLDNFGRGFVPLGFLTQLPFQGVKLDAMLFEHKNSRPHFNALFNVVQSIAKVFSAQLTVTRIETREMRETLRSQHIDLLQGNAIEKPTEAARAAEWLRKPDLFAHAGEAVR